jgi:hypothetical protein
LICHVLLSKILSQPLQTLHEHRSYGVGDRAMYAIRQRESTLH